jgi:hypothetical protein
MRTFTTSIVPYRREVAWTWFGAIILFAVLAYRSANNLNSRPLTMFFLALMVVPLAFIMVILRYLTRVVTIQLDTESIVLDIRKSSADSEGETLRFALGDIASYQIEFPNDRFACLVLKLNSGDKHHFSFRHKKRFGVKKRNGGDAGRNTQIFCAAPN